MKQSKSKTEFTTLARLNLQNTYKCQPQEVCQTSDIVIDRSQPKSQNIDSDPPPKTMLVTTTGFEPATDISHC